ncbi:MAG: hypothetical protein H6585_07640 [Flavobacteriales bacterium]|nr:hypothetical protein [Flavobacteriales bacterium]MCB9448198.1 hypothetical protein [Flavobacteriales bacterium]
MEPTDKEVLTAVAKAVKELDKVTEGHITNMDAFYMDTARELLVKIIRSNGYQLSDAYRIRKRK